MVKKGRGMMRTNLDIPIGLHRRLKLEAVRRGVSLKSLMLERLRGKRVSRRKRPVRREPVTG
jgi:hypothetical protein